MNNRDKRKFKKRKAREKSNKNKSVKKAFRFRLDALIDGKWKPVDAYSSKEHVDAYIGAIEEIRADGQDRIFPGRIYDVKKGRFIKYIDGFDPLDVGSITMNDVKNIKDIAPLEWEEKDLNGPTGFQG